MKILHVHHIGYITESGRELVEANFDIKESETNTTVDKLESEYEIKPVIVHLYWTILDK